MFLFDGTMNEDNKGKILTYAHILHECSVKKQATFPQFGAHASTDILFFILQNCIFQLCISIIKKQIKNKAIFLIES